MTKNLSMTLEVKHDSESDELYLELPQQLLDQLGWQINDVLVWEKIDSQSWSLSKKPS